MAPASSSAGRLFRGLTVLVALLATQSIASPTPQEETASSESADTTATVEDASSATAASEALLGGGSGGGGGHGNVDTYDYIVVGSGPGGGPIACNLAKANHTVLLLEAGDDQTADLTTQILSLSTLKQTTRWDFYVKHYSDQQQTLLHNHLTWRLPDGSLWVGPGATAPANATLLGAYYPRGATLGGSSVINIAATWLPNDREWNDIATLTGDSSWSASNMRSIFASIENNHYLSNPTPGHGFSGYLDTVSNDGTVFETNVGTTTVLKAMVAAVGQDPDDVIDMVQRDGNALDPNRDNSVGLFNQPFHGNQIWKRASARELILDTVAAGYPLTVKTHSLATRVLFRKRAGQDPRAVGVKYREGQSVYSADPRHGSSNTGTNRVAKARKEVILSAGVFNTPQLLKLSGVGPRAELTSFGIPVVANLPGVGENLQDNQELPVIGVGQDFFFPAPDPNDPVCTYGAPGDPCIDAFLNGTGPYTRAGVNTHAFLLKTNHSNTGDRDVLIFSGPFAFRTFINPDATVSLPADPANVYGLHMVRMNPANNAGTVKLRSTDPTDTPDINFNQFTGTGGNNDLEAMADVTAWGRQMFTQVAAPWGPMGTFEPPCTGTQSCRSQDLQWIKDQAWGHHATSTCAIGKASNKKAVLDTKLRVRGVKGLRVVDGSAFPRTPGAFPVVSTFMLSEKASVDVLAALALNEIVDVDQDVPVLATDEL